MAQDKVWFRVPDKSELPLGASWYWGFECHLCKTRMPIGDAGTKKAEQIQAIAAQKTGETDMGDMPVLRRRKSALSVGQDCSFFGESKAHTRPAGRTER